MKRDAILINCARGEPVDNAALSAALSSGVIGGAGLDGLELEQPSGGNPLLKLPHSSLIITPLVAWASEQAIEEFRQQLVDNLEAFVGGAPRNVVAQSFIELYRVRDKGSTLSASARERG